MDKYLYAVAIILFIWFVYKQAAPVKGLRNLSAEQFKSEFKGYTLIDVRETHEFRQGHIAGAVNIPLSQIQQRFKEVPRDKPVFIYCRSGMRSKQAGKWLSRKGYSQLAHLSGGIVSWKDPIVK